MKNIWKFLLLIGVVVICLNPVYASADGNYKVLRVVDGDTIYVDFNNDGQVQKDEKVRLNGIDAFEVSYSEGLTYQAKSIGISEKEALTLGYLGKEFAKKELLNRYVNVIHTAEQEKDKFGRRLVSVYYDDKCFEQEILKEGYALTFEKSNLYTYLVKFENKDLIKKNAQKTGEVNLVLINHKNGKCHKINCKNGQSASFKELIIYSAGKCKPTKCCF